MRTSDNNERANAREGGKTFLFLVAPRSAVNASSISAVADSSSPRKVAMKASMLARWESPEGLTANSALNA